MKIFIDRIENESIVCCCNNITFDLPLKLLPDVNEGDVFLLSKTEDDSAKERTQTLIDKLFE